MAVERFFLERREIVETHRDREARVGQTREEDRGLALDREEGASYLHRWRALPPSVPLGPLPEALRLPAERMLTASLLAPAPLQELFDALSALERSHPGARVEVRVREVRQQVACLGEEGLVTDDRRYALVEVRASVERDGKTASIQREHAFTGGAVLATGLPGILDGLPALWRLAELRLSATPVERGPTLVVLPPGADAGVLLHEVCGHPLEGDVVARGASYLAARLGQRVGGEHVTVLDNPCRGPGAVTYGIDDEGSPARAVPLVREGVVCEPLLDREAAAALGRAVNGHGRRVSFRHPPLPRMAHTELAPHRSRPEEIIAGVRRGLLVRYLTPRHVEIMTGDFSFYVVEGQEIIDGEVRGFIGPTILHGNGLAALAGIDAVGDDFAPFFSLKGCGKLGHGELPVSFGNPTVRISGMQVSPWT